MAWEAHGNRLYYYRKRREGHRVISRYVGTGMLANLAAQIDENERLRSETDRSSQIADREEMWQMNHDMHVLEQMITFLTRGVLLSSSYRPHKGQWRRSRHAQL